MAATIHVHVGQCGNQLGERFWALAAANEGSAAGAGAGREGGPVPSSQADAEGLFRSSNPLFHAYDGKAAAVFVDSECKVIDRVRANPALARTLRRDNLCTDSSGRANNWAMGFDASLRELEKGEGLFHSAVEALRREMERVDCLQGVVLHHSLAGGTGSGLGSAMLQYLREAAPALNLTTVSVAPFASGDCATQWYNAAFTLHALAQDADAVILRDNDKLLQHHLHAAAATAAGAGSGRGKLAQQRAASKASMSALNDSLSQDLACLFFPTFQTTTSLLLPPTPKPWDARALARACCPFTHAKFLDLRSSWSLPSTHQSQQPSSFRAAAAQGRRTGGSGDRAWLGLGQAVAATLPSQMEAARPVVTLAAQVTLRGVDPSGLPPATANPYIPPSTAPPADPALATLLGEQLPKALRLAPWRPAHLRGVEALYSLAQHSTVAARGGLALCANRSDAGAAVGRVLGRAAEMAGSRAYLHWYERHGVGVDDFAAAFDGLRRVVEEYGELAGGGLGVGVEWEEEQRALHRRAALRAVRDYAVN